MSTALTRPGPPAWQGCEVCRAAIALTRAIDILTNYLNAGGTYNPDDPRAESVKQARANWIYNNGGRHTGPIHTPMQEDR